MQKSVPRENLLEVFIGALLKRRSPEGGEFLSRYNVFVARNGYGSTRQIDKAWAPTDPPPYRNFQQGNW